MSAIGPMALMALMMAPGMLSSIPELADLAGMENGPKGRDRKLMREMKRADTLSNAMLLSANKADRNEDRRERVISGLNEESRFNSMMQSQRANQALAMLAQFMGGGNGMMEEAAIKALGRGSLRGQPQGPAAYNPIDDF